MLLRGRGALARLSHPNVMRVLNFFRANETVYMVMRYERGRALQRADPRADRAGERAVAAQYLRPAARRAARSAYRQAAAPGHQAGQRLPAQRRHAAADRFRRRAPGAVGRGPKLPPTLYAGLRRARACTTSASCSGRGPTSIRSAPPCTRACRAPAAAGERTPERRRLVPAKQAWAGKYSADLLEVIDWCMRLDHLKRPQSVLALQKALLGETPNRRPG